LDQIKKKSRNQTVDILRGIAMLLVVFGHTISGSTKNFQDSILYNIIWVLQMPLFILISGYITRYSHEINNGRKLLRFMARRTISYIFPWCVWSFLIRGLIFRQYNFLNLKYLLWHMDTGYWFLFSIWTISMIFGLSDFATNKILKNNNTCKSIFITGFFYVVGMIVLARLGSIFGFSFLSIKLTLYYMPFYFAGYIFGKIQDHLLSWKNGKCLIDVCTAVSLIIWLSLLSRFNLYSTSDSGVDVIIRATASLLGCIAICGMCGNIFIESKLGKVLCTAGIYSLEIYLSHYLVLNILKATNKPVFATLQGMSLSLGNYFLTLILVGVIVFMFNQNMVLRLLIFKKK
jgi:fucose 4-O-acetylase-like acetyltransferase